MVWLAFWPERVGVAEGGLTVVMGRWDGGAPLRACCDPATFDRVAEDVRCEQRLKIAGAWSSIASLCCTG